MSILAVFSDTITTTTIAAFGMLWEFVVGARAELFVFALAIIVHCTLFGTALSRRMFHQNSAMMAKCKGFSSKSSASCGESIADAEPQSLEECDQELQIAHEAGDFRSVLRCWQRMKRFDTMPSVDLALVVESMQRLKKDTTYILCEMKGFFLRHPKRCQMDEINVVLDACGRSLDSNLVEAFLEMMAEFKLEADAQTYEILLSMHFATRDFSMVRQTLAKMKSKNVFVTPRASVILLKAALRANDFEEVKVRFVEISESHSSRSSTNAMPAHLLVQIVELACRAHRLHEILPYLSDMHHSEFTADTINAMLIEAVQKKDDSLFATIDGLARSGPTPSLNGRSYQILLRAAPSIKDSEWAQKMFQEAMDSGVEINAEFASSVLACCAAFEDSTLAEALLKHTKPTQTQVVGALIRYFCDCNMHSKACDIHEWWRSERTARPENAFVNPRLDARTERYVIDAAMWCKRQSTVSFLVEASPSDVAKHITMIQACSARKNLNGAFAVFEALEKNGSDLTLSIYNTVLDACVECRDLQRAQKWMQRMRKECKVDVVSYNTLIKAQVRGECFNDARSLMRQMVQEGMAPNHITYNELILGYIRANNVRKVWEVVEEMKAADVMPNHVTCAILLKNLSPTSSKADIVQTMDLVGMIDEPMDEVLLSSVMEACVRVGKPELLSTTLAQLQGTKMSSVNGSHTFGSLIKAHGAVGDVDGAWKCWCDMRSRHIFPTSITIGCMVECVASNGDPEGAYELILTLLEDRACVGEINAVIYGSVLKAFARDKKMERVWAIYDDMLRRDIAPIVTTYNLLCDACARNGQMERIPELLAQMKKNKVEANLITFSTLLKGHCQRGDMQSAFETLTQMRSTTNLKPDEIMYNTLLDGCATHGMIDEGKSLIDQMQSEGIKPSNFTLSVLVKLMGNATKIDEVFDLVASMTKKHGFKANAHVYANLVQACVANRKLPRALAVLEEMAKDNQQPDIRTYSTALRACTNAGMYEQATALARAALGLPGHEPYPFRNPEKAPKGARLQDNIINELLKALVARGHSHRLAAPLLADIQSSLPQVRIHACTKKAVESRNNHPWRD